MKIALQLFRARQVFFAANVVDLCSWFFYWAGRLFGGNRHSSRPLHTGCCARLGLERVDLLDQGLQSLVIGVGLRSNQLRFRSRSAICVSHRD